jgi:two-component system LytT family response regulator
MRILIVDDEQLARMVLREYLTPHTDIEIVAECSNGFEAVKAIAELQPDLVFLDIQMPKLTGFEVVELAGQKTHYLFVTAYDQYALKAFEVHAVDYLLKPYTRERFDAALAHAKSRIGGSSSGGGGSNGGANNDKSSANNGSSGGALDQVLADAVPRQEPLQRILIRDGVKVHVVPCQEITCIEAQDDYIRISARGQSYLKAQRLADLETQLDARQFVRIHRSWIVNLASIVRIEAASKDSHCAVLADGSKLPISRSGYQKVKSIIA